MAGSKALGLRGTFQKTQNWELDAISRNDEILCLATPASDVHSQQLACRRGGPSEPQSSAQSGAARSSAARLRGPAAEKRCIAGLGVTRPSFLTETLSDWHVLRVSAVRGRLLLARGFISPRSRSAASVPLASRSAGEKTDLQTRRRTVQSPLRGRVHSQPQSCPVVLSVSVYQGAISNPGPNVF